MNKDLEPSFINDCYAWVKEQYFCYIKSQAVPCAKVRLTPQKTTITASKVGGLPYLPIDKAIISNGDGEIFRLLAQINCTDLQGLSGFPTQGILQFFVMADDWGGIETKVVYYKNIQPHYDEQALSGIYQPTITDNNCMQFGEYAMTFELKEDYPSFYGGFGVILCDKYLKNHQIDINYKQKSRLYRYIEYLYDNEFGNRYSYIHTQCGGIPVFAQDDPREKNDGYQVLLFQLTSEQDIMIGDMGVIHFFITPWDLQGCQFDNVLDVFDYH